MPPAPSPVQPQSQPNPSHARSAARRGARLPPAAPAEPRSGHPGGAEDEGGVPRPARPLPLLERRDHPVPFLAPCCRLSTAEVLLPPRTGPLIPSAPRVHARCRRAGPGFSPGLTGQVAVPSLGCDPRGARQGDAGLRLEATGRTRGAGPVRARVGSWGDPAWRGAASWDHFPAQRVPALGKEPSASSLSPGSL